MKRPLLCVIGASGSGKTTLCEEMESKYGLKQIPSYTTRPPRSTDEKGHTFVSDAEFNRIRENLVAYATTNNYEYGVTIEQIEDENYSLYIIDNTGIKYLKDMYKGDRPIITVFIDCPLVMRYERMCKRSGYTKNSSEFALNRIVHDAVEFKDVQVDYIIANNDGMFSNALTKLTTICVESGIIDTLN